MRLDTARLDAGEIEQRIDQLEQPQAIAVHDLDRSRRSETHRGAVGGRTSISSSGLSIRRQRRAELVTRVGKEGRS